MTWSLEQAYEEYPQIEEEFSAVLDESLHPRGPDLLYDLVGRLGLAPGAVTLDVGCGEGRQAVALHGRAGVQTGELLLVTDTGPERLHAYPPGLQQIG